MTTTSNAARTWMPSDRDRMIYKWAKFDGHKQSWIADQLELNQSTVSRIIERYERWVAHGGPAQQGGLNRDERLRAQVWLTYERNEWVIASALRLAGEMERLSDTSKSTTTHHCSDPSREIEVRTENSIRDRTGMAHRYLNLVNRVGKQQIQLIEKYDLPALEPLTLDEHEYAQALEDAKPKYVEVPAEESRIGVPPVPAAEFRAGPEFAAGPEFGAGLPTPPSARPQVSCPADPPFDQSQIPNPKSEIHSPPREITQPMSPTHNHAPTQSPLIPTAQTTSIEIAPHKKPTAYAYPVAANPPEPTDQLKPILDATPTEPPPIRILPLHIPLSAP